jgi:anti-sigma factor (TIGR02949 family)
MTDPKPISCDEALRVLAAFLDDELHDDARQGIERHLEVCRGCFSRAEFERRLKGEINRLARDEIPPSFERRVRRLLGSFGASPAGERADGSQT